MTTSDKKPTVMRMRSLNGVILVPPKAPKKGDDGHTPTEVELLNLIRPLIPQVKNGHTPTESELLALIRPLIPKPIPAHTPTVNELVAIIAPLIPAPIPGHTPTFAELKEMFKDLIPAPYVHVPETGDQLMEAINKGKGFIDMKRIRGIFEMFQSMVGGSSTTLEILTAQGNINGVNTVFTFTKAPSVIVVDEGRVMNKVKKNGGQNWTGTTRITLSVAPNSDIFGY